MTKVLSFSFPDNWTCLDELLNKLPRSIKASHAVKLAIEEKNTRTQKNIITLNDFQTEITIPRLDTEHKIWKTYMKSMEAEELRKLQKVKF